MCQKTGKVQDFLSITITSGFLKIGGIMQIQNKLGKFKAEFCWNDEMDFATINVFGIKMPTYAWTLEKTDSSDVWFRRCVQAGIEFGSYNLTRIVYGDGTKNEKEWKEWLEFNGRRGADYIEFQCEENETENPEIMNPFY